MIRFLSLRGGGLLGLEHAEAILAFGGTPILWDKDKKRMIDGARPLEEKYEVQIDCNSIDITCEGSVERATSEILRKHGAIHGLVNNAANNPKLGGGGIDTKSRLEEFSINRWNSDLAVGLTGAFICAKHVGPIIARRISLIALVPPVCRVCDFCFIFIPLRVITMNQKSFLMQYR